MSAYADVTVAVQALKDGANDFINKPSHLQRSSLDVTRP